MFVLYWFLKKILVLDFKDHTLPILHSYPESIINILILQTKKVRLIEVRKLGYTGVIHSDSATRNQLQSAVTLVRQASERMGQTQPQCTLRTS